MAIKDSLLNFYLICGWDVPFRVSTAYKASCYEAQFKVFILFAIDSQFPSQEFWKKRGITKHAIYI